MSNQLSLLQEDASTLSDDKRIATADAALQIQQDILDELGKVYDEIERATTLYPRSFVNAHEGWAVLREEVDEMWDAVKANDVSHARAEAVQVAAMAVRFLMEVEDASSN